MRADVPSERIDFINAAVGGYSSFESYGRLWSRIRFLEPDIIVVYHGWNEMYYFGSAERRPANFERFMMSWRTLADGSWTLDRVIRPTPALPPSPIDRLIWPSQVLTRARIRLADAPGEVSSAKRSRVLTSSYDRRSLEVWRTNLRFLRETSNMLGVELFVCKQATLIVPDLPVQERQRCRYEYHGFDHDTHVEAYQEIYDVIDQEIRPDRIIDVTSLSGRPELYRDHCHPTPAGTTRIAEIVAHALAEHLGTKLAIGNAPS